MKNNKGFTLIELLVVIAILAGFMALLVPNMMLVRVKARDMRRKSDLKSIQKALELYKQNQVLPEYPATASFPASCTVFSDANGVYLQKMPQDPLTSLSECGTAAANYYYIRDPLDAGKYTLCACLENSTDPEGLASCSAAPTCSGKYYKLIEP